MASRKAADSHRQPAPLPSSDQVPKHKQHKQSKQRQPQQPQPQSPKPAPPGPTPSHEPTETSLSQPGTGAQCPQHPPPKRLTQAEKDYFLERLPPGCQFYLERLARATIRSRPNNVVDFCAAYLEQLLVSRDADLWKLPDQPYFVRLFRNKMGYDPWQPRRRKCTQGREVISPACSQQLPDLVPTECLPETSLLPENSCTDELGTNNCEKKGDVDTPEMLTASDCQQRPARWDTQGPHAEPHSWMEAARGSSVGTSSSSLYNTESSCWSSLPDSEGVGETPGPDREICDTPDQEKHTSHAVSRNGIRASLGSSNLVDTNAIGNESDQEQEMLHMVETPDLPSCRIQPVVTGSQGGTNIGLTESARLEHLHGNDPHKDTEELEKRSGHFIIVKDQERFIARGTGCEPEREKFIYESRPVGGEGFPCTKFSSENPSGNKSTTKSVHHVARIHAGSSSPYFSTKQNPASPCPDNHEHKLRLGQEFTVDDQMVTSRKNTTATKDVEFYAVGQNSNQVQPVAVADVERSKGDDDSDTCGPISEIQNEDLSLKADWQPQAGNEADIVQPSIEPQQITREDLEKRKNLADELTDNKLNTPGLTIGEDVQELSDVSAQDDLYREIKEVDFEERSRKADGVDLQQVHNEVGVTETLDVVDIQERLDAVGVREEPGAVGVGEELGAVDDKAQLDSVSAQERCDAVDVHDQCCRFSVEERCDQTEFQERVDQTNVQDYIDMTEDQANYPEKNVGKQFDEAVNVIEQLAKVDFHEQISEVEFQEQHDELKNQKQHDKVSAQEQQSGVNKLEQNNEADPHKQGDEVDTEENCGEGDDQARLAAGSSPGQCGQVQVQTQGKEFNVPEQYGAMESQEDGDEVDVREECGVDCIEKVDEGDVQEQRDQPGIQEQSEKPGVQEQLYEVKAQKQSDDCKYDVQEQCEETDVHKSSDEADVNKRLGEVGVQGSCNEVMVQERGEGNQQLCEDGQNTRIPINSPEQNFEHPSGDELVKGDVSGGGEDDNDGGDNTSEDGDSVSNSVVKNSSYVMKHINQHEKVVDEESKKEADKEENDDEVNGFLKDNVSPDVKRKVMVNNGVQNELPKLDDESKHDEAATCYNEQNLILRGGEEKKKPVVNLESEQYTVADNEQETIAGVNDKSEQDNVTDDKHNTLAGVKDRIEQDEGTRGGYKNKTKEKYDFIQEISNIGNTDYTAGGPKEETTNSFDDNAEETKEGITSDGNEIKCVHCKKESEVSPVKPEQVTECEDARHFLDLHETTSDQPRDVTQVQNDDAAAIGVKTNDRRFFEANDIDEDELKFSVKKVQVILGDKEGSGGCQECNNGENRIDIEEGAESVEKERLAQSELPEDQIIGTAWETEQVPARICPSNPGYSSTGTSQPEEVNAISNNNSHVFGCDTLQDHLVSLEEASVADTPPLPVADQVLVTGGPQEVGGATTESVHGTSGAALWDDQPEAIGGDDQPEVGNGDDQPEDTAAVHSNDKSEAIDDDDDDDDNQVKVVDTVCTNVRSVVTDSLRSDDHQRISLAVSGQSDKPANQNKETKTTATTDRNSMLPEATISVKSRKEDAVVLETYPEEFLKGPETTESFKGSELTVPQPDILAEVGAASVKIDFEKDRIVQVNSGWGRHVKGGGPPARDKNDAAAAAADQDYALQAESLEYLLPVELDRCVVPSQEVIDLVQEAQQSSSLELQYSSVEDITNNDSVLDSDNSLLQHSKGQTFTIDPEVREEINCHQSPSAVDTQHDQSAADSLGTNDVSGKSFDSISLGRMSQCGVTHNIDPADTSTSGQDPCSEAAKQENPLQNVVSGAEPATRKCRHTFGSGKELMEKALSLARSYVTELEKLFSNIEAVLPSQVSGSIQSEDQHALLPASSSSKPTETSLIGEDEIECRHRHYVPWKPTSGSVLSLPRPFLIELSQIVETSEADLGGPFSGHFTSGSVTGTFRCRRNHTAIKVFLEKDAVMRSDAHAESDTAVAAAAVTDGRASDEANGGLSSPTHGDSIQLIVDNQEDEVAINAPFGELLKLDVRAASDSNNNNKIHPRSSQSSHFNKADSDYPTTCCYYDNLWVCHDGSDIRTNSAERSYRKSACALRDFVIFQNEATFSQALTSQRLMTNSQLGNTNNNGNVVSSEPRMVALTTDSASDGSFSLDPVGVRPPHLPHLCRTATNNLLIIDEGKVYTITKTRSSMDVTDQFYIEGTKQASNSPLSLAKNRNVSDQKADPSSEAKRRCASSHGDSKKLCEKINQSRNKTKYRTCQVSVRGNNDNKEPQKKDNCFKLGQQGVNKKNCMQQKQLPIKREQSKGDDNDRAEEMEDTENKIVKRKRSPLCEVLAKKKYREEMQKYGKSKPLILCSKTSLCGKEKPDNQECPEWTRKKVEKEEIAFFEPVIIKKPNDPTTTRGGEKSELAKNVWNLRNSLLGRSALKLTPPSKKEFPLRVRALSAGGEPELDYVPAITRRLTVESPLENMLVHTSFVRPNPRHPELIRPFEVTSQKKRLYLDQEDEPLEMVQARRLVCEPECFSTKDPTTQHLVIENGTSDVMHATVKVVPSSVKKQRQRSPSYLSSSPSERAGTQEDSKIVASGNKHDLERLLQQSSARLLGNYLIIGKTQKSGPIKKMLQDQEKNVEVIKNKSTNALVDFCGIDRDRSLQVAPLKVPLPDKQLVRRGRGKVALMGRENKNTNNNMTLYSRGNDFPIGFSNFPRHVELIPPYAEDILVEATPDEICCANPTLRRQSESNFGLQSSPRHLDKDRESEYFWRSFAETLRYVTSQTGQMTSSPTSASSSCSDVSMIWTEYNVNNNKGANPTTTYSKQTATQTTQQQVYEQTVARMSSEMACMPHDPFLGSRPRAAKRDMQTQVDARDISLSQEVQTGESLNYSSLLLPKRFPKEIDRGRAMVFRSGRCCCEPQDNRAYPHVDEGTQVMPQDICVSEEIQTGYPRQVAGRARSPNTRSSVFSYHCGREIPDKKCERRVELGTQVCASDINPSRQVQTDSPEMWNGTVLKPLPQRFQSYQGMKRNALGQLMTQCETCGLSQPSTSSTKDAQLQTDPRDIMGFRKSQTGESMTLTQKFPAPQVTIQKESSCQCHLPWGHLTVAEIEAENRSFYSLSKDYAGSIPPTSAFREPLWEKD